MRHKRMCCLLFGLCLIFLVGCTLTEPQVETDEEAAIAIVEPVEGSQFQIGVLIKVRALVSSTVGAKEVDLVINGNILRRDQLDVPLRHGNMLQPWQPSEPGEYLIQVYMTTTAGKIVQSNAVLVKVVEQEQPPTVEVQPTTQVPEPVETITPTITLTLPPPPSVTSPPSITPSLTWPPTDTFTPSPEPLAAPEPIAPSGSYYCSSTIFLEWHAVYHPNGVSYYEWIVYGQNGTESGTTTDVKVEYLLPSCSASYSWKVRAVDGLGNPGPYSPEIPFTIE